MDLKIGSEIGRGSFASVYKGEYKSKPVAVKSVLRSKLNKKLLENLESEISILKRMSHPHVVCLIDYQQTNSHFHLIMEYCSLGDLSYFIRRKDELSNSLPLIASLFERYPSKQGLHQDLAIHFLKQLASALRFLRDKNLVHRDIKPQNLLLCPPQKSQQQAKELGYCGQWELPTLKLADFGFARILPSTSLAETLCGSPLYMAPEILRYEKYNAKADLWSVGAVLYEMLVGKPPFKAANHVELLKKIEQTNDQIVLPSTIINIDLQRLIKQLLKKSPTERMGFNEFFNDPILINDSSTTTTNNSPLDTNKLDETMFISDYIRKPIVKHVSKDEVITSAGMNAAITAMNAMTNQQQKTSISSNSSSQLADEVKPSSSLFQQVYNKRISPSPPYGSSNNNKSPSPGASSTVERDYVVVEKRTVEVNALADEFSRSPTHTRRLLQRQGGSRSRSPSTSTKSSNNRQQLMERRNSIGYGTSPTSALARALSMASARLFGTNTNTATPDFSQYSIPVTIEAEERKLIKSLETLATKAKVVNLFAEVKFSQLIPEDSNADDMPLEVLHVVSEEALSLYVKTLSLLAIAMDKARIWWKCNETTGASARLIETVQWIRDRFNECLEKAEYAQSLFDYNNNITNASNTGAAAAAINASTSSTVSAEKLIFDRALEMSRAAAVNELINKDLEGCEMSYGTAIWMLEALLDDQEGQLEEEDRKVVEKFVASISNRLCILRGKLQQPAVTAVTGSATTAAIAQPQGQAVIGISPNE